MNDTTFDDSSWSDYRCGTSLKYFKRNYAQIHGWASLLVCIFGSIANSLNIAVLTRREMRSPTNMILTGLAIADLLVMMEYIPYVIHLYLYRRSRRDTYTYAWGMFVLFHSNFAQVCHTVSICLTLTLAIWRYIAVAYPQKNREWCSYKRTIMAITGAYIMCPILCVPLYVTTQVKAKYELLTENGDSWDRVNNRTYQHFTITNTTLYFVNLTETAENHVIIEKLNFIIYSVFIKLIPCVCLTLLSIKLVMVLLEAKNRRRKLAESTTKLRNVVGSNEELNRSTNFCERSVVTGQQPSTNDEDVTILKTKQQQRKRHKKQDKEKQADRTTMMLLAVLLLFLVTELPQGILGLLTITLGTGFFHTCYVMLGMSDGSIGNQDYGNGNGVIDYGDVNGDYVNGNTNGNGDYGDYMNGNGNDNGDYVNGNGNGNGDYINGNGNGNGGDYAEYGNGINGVNGNGDYYEAVNGNSVNGNSMNGNGINGDYGNGDYYGDINGLGGNGENGNGMMEDDYNDLNGDGFNGNGLNGNGDYVASINGHGGNGINGNGDYYDLSNGNGINGNGLNGINGNGLNGIDGNGNGLNGLNGNGNGFYGIDGNGNGNGFNGINGNGLINGMNGDGLNGIDNGINGNGLNGINGNEDYYDIIDGHGINGNGINGNGINGINGNGINGNGMNGINGNGINGIGETGDYYDLGINGNGNEIINGNGLNGNGINGNGNGIINGNGLNGNGLNGNGNGFNGNGINGNGNGFINGNGVNGNGLYENGLNGNGLNGNGVNGNGMVDYYENGVDGDVIDILTLINSAINFILYCTMSRQFRTTFDELFCRWRPMNRWMPVLQHPMHENNNGNTGTNQTIITQVTHV